MSFDPNCPHPVPVVGEEPLLVIGTGHPFTFRAGHHMRLALCSICREPIGGGQAAVIGFADVDHAACMCGWINACALVVHACCSTNDDEALVSLVAQTRDCEAQHPAA